MGRAWASGQGRGEAKERGPARLPWRGSHSATPLLLCLALIAGFSHPNEPLSKEAGDVNPQGPGSLGPADSGRPGQTREAVQVLAHSL